MAQNKSTVFYSQNPDRIAFVDKIIEHFRHEISGKIFVKINQVSYEPYPTTTHPDIVETIIKRLQGADLIVGDAPAVDVRKFKMENSDIYKICEKYNVPFINLYEREMQTLESSRGYKITVSKIPLECDYIISLPILKVHRDCSMTGALKNAFGYLGKKDRIHMHIKKKNIHQGIAELNTFLKPHLTIMDAIITLTVTNEVRHGGIKQDLGYLLAGKDPVALDAYGFTLLKNLDSSWPPETLLDILHIKKSIELGIGNPEYNLTGIN